MKTEDELFREIMADIGRQETQLAAMREKMEEIRRLLHKFRASQNAPDLADRPRRAAGNSFGRPAGGGKPDIPSEPTPSEDRATARAQEK